MGGTTPGDRFLGRRHQVHGLDRGQLTSVRAGQREQPVDQCGQSLGLADDVRQDLLGQFRIRVGHSDLGLHTDRGHR
ncbi:hypothetical protein GCM10029964_008200 [Kibdelosporangium lantanae]